MSFLLANFKRSVPKMGGGLTVLGFFCLVAIVFTFPLITRLSDTLPDLGDPADVSWKMAAMSTQLTSDPLNFYRNPNFYPLSNSIALGELLAGLGFLSAPIIWLTGNPVLAYNLLNLASFVLSGFAMWLLVRHLTGNSAAGIVAGLIYAFSPWHYSHYGHLPLSQQQWMVFALYFLVKALAVSKFTFNRATLVNFGLFSFFFWLQAITAGYFAYFETILVGLYLLYFFGKKLVLLIQKRRTDWTTTAAQTGLSLGSLGLAFAFIIPFALPFITYGREFRFKRDLSEVGYWSAAPANFLQTMPQSWWYEPIQNGIFGLQTSAERAAYPGLIAVILTLVGLIGFIRQFGKGQKDVAPPVENFYPYFGLVALTGVILSLGPVLQLAPFGEQPTNITLPYRWLYQIVPGFDALRVPLRFGQLTMLGLAVCAGYGVAALLSAVQKRTSASLPLNLAAGMLILLAGLEFFAPSPPAITATTPEVYKWLNSAEAFNLLPKDALLVELPITELSNPVTTNPRYLLYNLLHGRPLLNGSANIIPFGYARLVHEMYSFPAPDTLDIIEGLGVQGIIVHPASLASAANGAAVEKEATSGGRLELLKSFDGTNVYRLKSARERFAELENLLPSDAEVLLVGDAKNVRLYPTIVPHFLRAGRKFYATYPTIYDRALKTSDGQPIEILPAPPGKTYRYAIFYRNGGINPADYGFGAGDRLPLSSGLPLEVYRK